MPSAGHHRPVGLGQDPAFEKQDAVVIVGNQERFRQHRAVDLLRAQTRTAERLGFHAATPLALGLGKTVDWFAAAAARV